MDDTSQHVIDAFLEVDLLDRVSNPIHAAETDRGTRSQAT
jgi:hypothetical protein